jgi:hypothetical protein
VYDARRCGESFGVSHVTVIGWLSGQKNPSRMALVLAGKICRGSVEMGPALPSVGNRSQVRALTRKSTSHLGERREFRQLRTYLPQATVNKELNPGHVTALIRGEKGRDLGNLFRARQTP